MGMKGDYLKGDIVEVSMQNGNTKEALILKCNEDYASALILSDRPPFENSVSVISRQKMYADTARLGYIFYDNIRQFIKSLPEEEVNRVLRKIAEAFEIEKLYEFSGSLETVEEVRESKMDVMISDEDLNRIRDMIKECVPASPEPETSVDKSELLELQSRLIKAEAERDIYKALFEKERDY